MVMQFLDFFSYTCIQSGTRVYSQGIAMCSLHVYILRRLQFVYFTRVQRLNVVVDRHLVGALVTCLDFVDEVKVGAPLFLPIGVCVSKLYDVC